MRRYSEHTTPYWDVLGDDNDGSEDESEPMVTMPTCPYCGASHRLGGCRVSGLCLSIELRLNSECLEVADERRR